MMDEAERMAWFGFLNEIGIIAQLSRTMMEQRLPAGLTLPHFAVINHLMRLGDGKTPQQLASAFQVPKPSMTNTLAGLEQRYLIRMTKHPQDGRSKQVWLTEKGRGFHYESITALQPDIDSLAGKIRLADVAGLTPELARIRKILDDMRND